MNYVNCREDPEDRRLAAHAEHGQPRRGNEAENGKEEHPRPGTRRARMTSGVIDWFPAWLGGAGAVPSRGGACCDWQKGQTTGWRESATKSREQLVHLY